MKTRFFALVLLLFCITGNGWAQKKTAPVRLIFDTDMGPDYDDVGAIALLHSYADSGYVNILATIASTKYEGVAGVLNVLNTYFGRPGIPLGVPKGWAYPGKDAQHWTDSLLANYPHKIKKNSEAADAVQVYRQLLAKQPDKSVTLVTVGFFTNINNLYQSGPDRYSPLTGAELINRKVKQMVSMAGRYPHGKEFNVYKDSTAAYALLPKLKIPLIFTGWEIGAKIKTGIRLINNPAIKNSPVKDVFRIAIPQAPEDKEGRMSWDQTAVLIAVKGIHPYFDAKRGTITVERNGANGWIEDPAGNAVYVTQRMPWKELAVVIENGMMHQPRQK
ncbi:nucleoside hydrolase [Niabella soli]|uniref:Nucleoside hydrolase n=1 Tax=Niabella soli DSM 19437 TaxID=929713 RepID=W0F281_9BACT|nr:nucleoside hydrolase [Niabella soli]AHF15436.1 nucleoside hydrolase [Niabella soli DSM 19437]